MMTTVNGMRLLLSFFLTFSSAYGFQISLSHHGISSLDAATQSPLFRGPPSALTPTTGAADLPGFLRKHNVNSRPRLRIPSSLLSLAFAVMAFAWTNSMIPKVAHATRQSTTTNVQTSSTTTRKNLGKGVGIVLVAGGAGALVGSTLQSNKGENVIEDDDNDEGTTISSSGGEPEAPAAENEPEEEQSPYQKASAKAVERILDRVKDEKRLSVKDSVAPKTEREPPEELESKIPPTPVVSRDLEKPNVNAPPTPVDSMNILQEKSSETLLKRTKSFTKKVNARLHGRRQPLDDPELVEKYAAIDSLEDRAFQILLDLNMVQRTPNPDNPDYKYAEKETEGEEEHEQ